MEILLEDPYIVNNCKQYFSFFLVFSTFISFFTPLRLIPTEKGRINAMIIFIWVGIVIPLLLYQLDLV